MATKAPKGKQAKKDFDDTNRGVLFPNEKDGNENRPDMTGSLAINPEDYEVGGDGLIRIRLAAWQKHSEKTGADYLSVSASPPQQK